MQVSASPSGNDWELTVSATLPAGTAHYIAVPNSSTYTYDRVGNTTDELGNAFDMVEIPSDENASFTLTVPDTLTAPDGVNVVMFSYDGELYVAGNATTLNTTNCTVVNVPTPTGVWFTSATPVKNYLNTSLEHAKLYFNADETCTIAQSTAIEVTPTSWVNITPISYIYHGATSHHFTADAPEGEDVAFTLNGLEPDTVYSLYVDGTVQRTFEVGGDGTASFTWDSWSEHDFTVTRTGAISSLVVGKLQTLLLMGVLMVLILLVGGMAMAVAPKGEGEMNSVIQIVLIAGMVIAATGLLVYATYGTELISWLAP